MWRFLTPDVSSLAGRALAQGGIFLLALLFLGGGGLSAWHLGGAPLWDAWRSRDWPPVTAIMEDVSLSHMGAQGVRVSVLYRYPWEGQTFWGRRYGLHVWTDNADAQRAAYADLLFRRRTRAWVNPRHPEEALLNRDIHGSVVLMALPALGAVALGGVLFWAAGVGAWRNVRVWRRRHRKPGGAGQNPGV
ncbi:MAG: DUF3592 domain-containing protein [Zoogloeaceae bacterium]|jgi:hypothetical protein|nr:DUF3592 domain-containing protein [Zoogloeaceae bacterium]